ncbi:vesicle transport v-SNARE family protein [Striga asiatica]|uniref:Vesicle transport v-SNARE family protein n=1 Tax=Striga asiatica TaxID=4170 RepID=A0A5A7Q3U2_STRAF|nr:vesicle transport v-SNARE family protein [Striga asiatica]
MEGSEKWRTPSKSASSPKSPKIVSGVNDENDSTQSNVYPNFHNQKKAASKHFMSTTVSAASKAAPLRRKILSERDENSVEPGFGTHKTSYPNKKQIPRNTRPNFPNQSSLKAYDPLKNYLSPRPKFLRFNPNRRREIFSRLEKEELSDSSDSREVNSEESDSREVNSEEVEDYSLSTLKGSPVKPEREENNRICDDDDDYYGDEDEEEGDEEEIEEKGWCFRGLIVKFVLILIACAVSTLYICTMNLGKDGLSTIKRQSFEVTGVKMWGSGGYVRAEAGDNCGEFEEGEFVGGDVNWDDQRSLDLEIIEDDGVQILGVAELEEDENGEFEGSLKVEGDVESDFENSGKDEDELVVENEKHDDCEDKTDGVEIEDARNAESEVKIENLDELVNAENDESLLREVESSHQALNEDNTAKTKAAENENEHSTVELADRSQIAEKNNLEMEINAPDQNHELKLLEKTEAAENKIEQSTGERTNESENVAEKNLGIEMKDLDQMQELELADKSTLTDDPIDNSGHVVVEDEEAGRRTPAVIGFLMVSIILACLTIAIYNSKKKPRNYGSADNKKSKHVLGKPNKTARVEEKRKVEFIARPSVLHHPAEEEEASRKLDHKQQSYVPNVELIGEFVLDQPSSRRIKKQEIESSGEGNVSYFLRKHETLTPPAVSEYSNMSATSSYGSFTTQTQIMKKEGGGQNGEHTPGLTPVRRSSRLRSRAAVITSP